MKYITSSPLVFNFYGTVSYCFQRPLLQILKSLCYTKNEENVSWKNAGSEEESTNKHQ